MQNTDNRLDLSVSELTSTEMPLNTLASIDLSATELENLAAPDVGDFVASVAAATAVSGVIAGTIGIT